MNNPLEHLTLQEKAQNTQDFSAEESFLKLLEAITSFTGEILAFRELNYQSELHRLKGFKLNSSIKQLFDILASKGKIEEINGVNKELLSIRSDQVLKAIMSNTGSWKEEVPNQIVPIFDYHTQSK